MQERASGQINELSLLRAYAMLQVYKGVRGGVTTVAVKVMGETHAEQQQANRLMEQTELFEREIHLLKSCRDRNIVQFLGACMQVS